MISAYKYHLCAFPGPFTPAPSVAVPKRAGPAAAAVQLTLLRGMRMNTDDSLHERGRALIMFILKGLNRKGTHTKHSLISTAGEVDWVKKTLTHTEDSIKAAIYCSLLLLKKFRG